MYLRFTAPGAVTRARVAPGLFGPACDLWWSRTEDTPTLLGIRAELDWFNEWLPVPRRFGVVAKGRTWSDGICWFRDNAHEAIAHGYVLAALIAEAGIPIDHIWTRDPGQVLYRDRWQVVAKPERYLLQ